MPEEKRFSHISVHAEDDEVVIQAGAVADSPCEPEPAARPAEAAAPEAGAAAAMVPEDVPTSDEAPSVREAEVESDADVRADSDARGYRETTLEDLEGGKTPIAQKVVIVAAILLIVCAIVYGVAFA